MYKNEDVVEIDLLKLVKKLWQRKFFIIFISLLFTGVSVSVSMFAISPRYTATTKIYIVERANSSQGLTAQDLQTGAFLVNDYKEIVLSSSVLQSVIEQRGLDRSVEDLSKIIKVDSPNDTRVLTISVTDTDKRKASIIANTIRMEASKKIKDVAQIESVNLIEGAVPPKEKSSPSITKNGAIGLLLGLVLSIGWVIIKDLTDDRVEGSGDVEDGMDMILLGYVPMSKKLAKSGKRKRK